MRDLEEVLAAALSEARVPGAAVGVLHDGEVRAAFSGVADVARAEPVTADTRFAAASITKIMTAGAIAKLVARGRLALDDAVGSLLPELRRSHWAATATVADLLANRSRVPLSVATEFDGAIDADEPRALIEFARALADRPAGAAAWSYSNAGWSVLGRVLEQATGRAWRNAVREELVIPASMTGVAFGTDPVREPRAVGHHVADHGWSPADPGWSHTYAPAGTSALVTIHDLIRLGDLLLRDRDAAVLRQEATEVAIHAWLDAWCLGMARFDWLGGSAWGWDGVAPGQRGCLRVLPEQGGAVAVLANASTGRVVMRSVLREVVSSSFGVEVPPLLLEPVVGAAGDVRRFEGSYTWPDLEVGVRAIGDALEVEARGRVRIARPLDGRSFVVDATDPDVPSLTFDGFDASGRPRVLYRMLWGLPRSV